MYNQAITKKKGGNRFIIYCITFYFQNQHYLFFQPNIAFEHTVIGKFRYLQYSYSSMFKL